MVTRATEAAILRWLATRFDCEPAVLSVEGARAQRHGPSLADYNGVYIWRMGRMAIVSAPSALIAAVRRASDGQPATALIDEAFWRAALSERVERVIGPAYQGFCDVGAFQPADTLGTRSLNAADASALRAFVSACPPEDWRDSGIALDHDPLIGLEPDGALIALASAPLDGRADDAMRSVSVVTLPAWRGTGAGLAVVSAVTQRGLEMGAIMHYQTLRANLPSVAIARRLGFEDVATTLAVRLR